MNTSSVKEELYTKLDIYLNNHNWKLHKCSSCGNEYYSKRDLQICGSSSCQQGYSFINYSKKKGFLFLESLLGQTKEFFQNQGYELTKPKNVINNRKYPFFVVAGIQCLDDVIYDGADKPKNSIFVAQPSVRLNDLKNIGKEALSTSFINICTEQVDTSIDDHIKNFDKWLTYLSKVGLFVNDMTVVKKDNWQGGLMEGVNVMVYYGGLGLGDAVYVYKVNQKEGLTNLTISDIGFGLERVCWAINKTKSYYDAIGPFDKALKGEYAEIDIVRNLALLSGSGIVPSNKDAGYRFRQLAKKLVETQSIAKLDGSFDYYYDFWSTITVLNKSLEHSKKNVKEELNRDYNSLISESLNMKPDEELLKQDQDEFIKSLIKKGIKLEKITTVINNLQNKPNETGGKKC